MKCPICEEEIMRCQCSFEDAVRAMRNMVVEQAILMARSSEALFKDRVSMLLFCERLECGKEKDPRDS